LFSCEHIGHRRRERARKKRAKKPPRGEPGKEKRKDPNTYFSNYLEWGRGGREKGQMKKKKKKKGGEKSQGLV